MKKVFVTLVVALTFSTGRTEILDQYQEDYDAWAMICNEFFFAQTFTPGISGRLDYIDLHIGEWALWPPGYPSIISIVSTAGGVPNGSALGEVEIPEPVDGWNTIDFLAESVFLSAGTQYGIVLSNDDPEPYDHPSVTWGITEADSYLGGSLWVWMADVGWNQDAELPTHDFALMDATFRTYMVPEPATIMLFGLGGLLLRKRRPQSLRHGRRIFCAKNGEAPHQISSALTL